MLELRHRDHSEGKKEATIRHAKVITAANQNKLTRNEIRLADFLALFDTMVIPPRFINVLTGIDEYRIPNPI